MFGFLDGGHDYFETQLEGEPREYLIPIQPRGEPVSAMPPTLSAAATPPWSARSTMAWATSWTPCDARNWNRTCSDLAALTPLNGVDLLPHLNGESNRPPHESLFWRTRGGVSYAVRQGNWKLVKASGSAAPELYDLASDVGESRDLAPTEQAAVSMLQQAYDNWNRAMTPPVFPGPPPARNPDPNSFQLPEEAVRGSEAVRAGASSTGIMIHAKM